MILLRPRLKFSPKRRWPIVKVTRRERAANIAARRELSAAFEEVFVDIIDAFRLDADDVFRRQLTTGSALGIPQSAMEGLELDFGAALGESFQDAIERGSQIGLRFAGVPGIDVDAGLITELGSNWIRSEGAQRIAGINQTVRRAVNQIVAEAVQTEISPTAAANRIGRQVGLSPRQAQAVRNFEATLVRQRIPTPEADTQFARETIARDVERFRDRQLRQRGRQIAESEMQAAVQSGERMFWEQAIATEQVDGGLLAKRWFTVQDERVCPICAPLHGQIQPFGSSYASLGFVGESPPAHVQCRCYLQYAPAGEFN